MRVVARWLLVVTVMLVVPHAHAQTTSNDDTVRQMLNLALDNIQRGLCEKGKNCSPATAEERSNPPLSVAEAKAVVSRAVISAMGEHCGLDWQRLNFLPMMSHWRGALKSERKVALVSMLHGIAQGQVLAVLAKRGPCTDTARRDVEARLPFRA